MTIRIVNADCLEALKGLDDCSVDAVITDPPYGLSNTKPQQVADVLAAWVTGDTEAVPAKKGGFMGKDWDSFVPPPAVWEECMRVLKPGGHMAVFAGARTQDLMGLSIRLAGFEIRDTLGWIYGCLSEDTEVLINGKWVQHHKAKVGDLALCYNREHDTYEWKPIEDTHKYEYGDTAYRIHSNNTDQIVSRNHRVLVERGGAYEFEYAENLAREHQVRVPVLESLPALLDDLPVPQQVPGASEQVLQRELRDVRPSTGCGETDRATRNREATSTDGGCASCESRAGGQSVGEPVSVRVESGSQAVRGARYTVADLADIEPVRYEGVVWCLTVPTGAFVVRRNGKVFVTGNSGFPKSHDIGKAIDKAAGAERDVIGTAKGARNGNGENVDYGAFGSAVDGTYAVTAPATPEAEQWDGWGTALKPAIEPIILARKPLEGTVAGNVLAYGVGGLNIDASRVGTSGGGTHCGNRNTDGKCLGHGDAGKSQSGATFHADESAEPAGRFPANVLLDEHAAAEMDKQSGNAGGGFGVRGKGGSTYANGQGFANTLAETGQTVGYGDSGGASRFFPVFKYQAKAPKKERPVIVREDGAKVQHPTVKPVALLDWLVSLIVPPGGTVLDPFAGSGTTLQAAAQKGFNSIGIEQSAEYVELINQRLADAGLKGAA